MKSTKIFVLLVVGVLLAACGAGDEPAIFEQRRLERTSGDCSGGEDAPCGRFLAVYPEFVSGQDDEVLRSLNAAVQRMLLAPITRDSRPESLEALADAFIAEYEKARQAYPDSASVQRWFMEKELSVLHQSPSTITLRLEESTYTGGAHPNSFLRLRSFDPDTGRRIALEDVVTGGVSPDLLAVAGSRFREQRRIEAGQTLTDAGYWFENDSFSLNDNWGIVPEGILFHYDPYEIGPYATGPIDLLLTRDDLKGLLTAEGPLGDLAD